MPLLLPGSLLPVNIKLMPAVTEEDRQTVESVTKLLNFLLRGSRSTGDDAPAAAAAGGGGGGGGIDIRALQELGPLLPAVATEVLPELLTRLYSRVTARAIRDVYADIEPAAFN